MFALFSLDHSITVCHIERSENIKGFSEKEIDRSKPKVLLTTDISPFGENNELTKITTEFDTDLDTQSSAIPGRKT